MTLGPNAWLVDEMFERYRSDPDSVSDSWREFFQDYSPGPTPSGKPTTAPAAGGNGAPRAPAPAPAPAPPGAQAQAQDVPAAGKSARIDAIKKAGAQPQ